MTVLHAPDVTDTFVTHYVRRTANALVEEGTFPRSDLEDVSQELQLALLEQIDNFDPAKSRWSTFAKNVIRMSAISLRRRQRAQCRQGHCELSSLNVTVEDGDGDVVELGATVSEEEHRTGSGQDFISHTDQADQASDLQQVLATVPEDLREIAERLQFHTPTEVRRELGISRTTMQRRLAALRERLREAGVADVR